MAERIPLVDMKGAETSPPLESSMKDGLLYEKYSGKVFIKETLLSDGITGELRDAICRECSSSLLYDNRAEEFYCPVCE